MLEVENLHAAYGRIPILNGISLRAEKGELVGLLGHNGMGKTTLLRTLMGFLPATTGRVSLAGSDITAAPSHRRVQAGMGYVPQGREIFSGLTVLDNLRMGCAKDAAPAEQIIAPVLEAFPRLKPLLDRAGGALSGGEQQLLAIARCLCGNPRLVLLDEPTEGIQPSIVEEIAETLSRLKDQLGLTVLLVEQNLDFIATLAQRVLIIQKGRITREVSTAQLQDTELVAEFVGISGRA
jgi:branched-chain amino acid transport system ATP-binding protein